MYVANTCGRQAWNSVDRDIRKQTPKPVKEKGEWAAPWELWIWKNGMLYACSRHVHRKHARGTLGFYFWQAVSYV